MVFNWVGGAWLWVSMFDVFWVLFEVVVLGGVFWPQVSIVRACVRARVCVNMCVCVCAGLGIFGASTGEKKIF